LGAYRLGDFKCQTCKVLDAFVMPEIFHGRKIFTNMSRIRSKVCYWASS
jgi:hypothetical protein